MRSLQRGLLLLLVLLGPVAIAQGAEIQVTTTADLLAADGLCSLREAVFAARDNTPFQGCAAGAAAGTDTILLDAQTYALSLPGAGEAGNMTGDLDTGIQAVRITGRGTGSTAIDASRIDRAFDLVEGASLTLEDLSVRNGRGPEGDPGEAGGAIRSQGALTALRVSFVANSAGDGSSGSMGGGPIGGGGAGGAIASRPGIAGAPSLTVTDSSFVGNLAGDGGLFSGPGEGNGGDGGRGGAIEVEGGTATISRTTFSGNLAGVGGNGGTGPAAPGPGGAGGVGGAIYVFGAAVSISTSTFAANRAGAGGLTGGDPSMPARGGSGGALFADSSSTTDVEYSTFSGNLRGPVSFPEGANGVAGGRVAGAILADPAPACQNVTAGPVRSVTLPGDASCPGPRLEGDPRLGPLAANGGPTPTFLPGPGSAAIDALAGAACPATDQRGLPRPRLGGCDAGSVEVQPDAAGARPGASGTSSPAARRVSGLRLRPAAFRAAGAGGSVGKVITTSAQRAPIGTTVAYRLDGAGRVTFTIRKPLAGRRAGRRCVRPAAAPPGARRCTRQQGLKGSFAHRGAPGQNSFRFTGRLRRKALAPGPYTLVAKLANPARGRGTTATRAFRIVR